MGYKLGIPSDWTNVINTIVFEFVLLAFLFYLTADVCARFNYLALLDGSVQDLVAISPPLVGGGLISTSRKRSILMIALRGLGIFLIFGSALSLDGETETNKVFITKQVRIAADVPLHFSRRQVFELVELRMTCITSENSAMVFGRLDNDGYCETYLPLLERPIRIWHEATRTNIPFRGGCSRNEKVLREYQFGAKLSQFTFTCGQGIQKASMVCIQNTENKRDNPLIYCIGLFKLSDSKWAICQNLSYKPSLLPISVVGLCRSAENLEEIHDRWATVVGNRTTHAVNSTSILNAMTHSRLFYQVIAAVSVSGVENRIVASIQKRDVTNIHGMWFLCFAVKLLLVVSLAISSIWLRMKRAKAVLNDGRALVKLLRQVLSDSYGSRSGTDRRTIYLHLQNLNDGTRSVWASLVPNLNIGDFNTED